MPCFLAFFNGSKAVITSNMSSNGECSPKLEVDVSAFGQSTAEALRQCEAELGLQTGALAHFRQVAASRELRVLQLEQEVNEQCQRQGKAARYSLRFEPDTRLTPARPLGDDAMPMA